MTLPASRIKHSVAVVVRHGSQVLCRRRTDDDDEFPGVWGLPAGTYRQDETLEQLVERIGRAKLGVDLVFERVLASGIQERPSYTLEMQLVEARMEGSPGGFAWKWSEPAALAKGAALGSLCCRLMLELGR